MQEQQDKLTPVFAQYQSIKKNYPDALLFYRMGDFYELFYDDAVTASRELQLVLTSRNKSGASAIPMCGVPWHAAQSYLAQLIDKGYNVAICEQIGDPKASKGIVERAVTTVITPGTVLDENNLGAKSHNYLGAVFCGLHSSAFAWADVSTGKWSGLEFRRQSDLWQWVGKFAPKELLLVDGQQPPANFNHEGIRLAHQPSVNFELKRASERLFTVQNVKDLASLGLEDKPSLVRACGAILAYLDQTQVRMPVRMLPFRPLDVGRRLVIDELTEKNLELFTRLNGQKGRGTLRHVLDETITSMGGRLLEDMLHNPWRDLKIIRQIQECVAIFMERDDLRASLRTLLESVRDMERLIMRLSINRCGVQEFLALRESFLVLPSLPELFSHVENVPGAMRSLLTGLDTLEDCASLLATALTSGEPEEGVFKKGYNAALDEQIELLENGERKLAALLESEQKRTGIAKLKLGYNRVFGYYFEATRAGMGPDIPEHFIRRQSLANCERFTTVELKQLEENLLMAGERRKELENEMLENLRTHLSDQKERILQTADLVAQLDYWQSLAEVGRREEWVLPEVCDDSGLHIREGRHPVIESITGKANFVPNDFLMDREHRLCLLTGPNMAGKSTILRQVALICLLAQMGAPVPARSARIGIVDRLFSRVGASDNLAQGQSTFMVEMMETARILRQAGKRSLVILDEIGRGTSTYDGMALAWAVVEDLASRCQGNLRVIFATHYHELTSLEGRIPGLFNMNVAVGAYDKEEILFLHRLLPGPADRSYGVEVARLAGVPYPVVQRARDLLKSLEQTKAKHAIQALMLPGVDMEKSAAGAGQTIVRELRKLDINTLDPENALKLISGWLNLPAIRNWKDNGG